jgi:hypothetical protein
MIHVLRSAGSLRLVRTLGLLAVCGWAALDPAPKALPAATVEVELTPLEGAPARGTLLALGPREISLQTAQGRQTWPLTQVLTLDLASPDPAARPQVWLNLRDGGQLAATAFTSRDGQATVTLAASYTVTLPVRSIRTVRFRPQTPDLAAQWTQLVASAVSSDLVVLRKTSTRTVEQPDAEPVTMVQQALDQHEGTIHAVTDDTVQFEIEGQTLHIRREKLEGLVFYSPPAPAPAPALCRLSDTGGSTWLLAELTWEQGVFRGRTVGRVPLEIPTLRVGQLDFSAGNVVWLSDLEPEGGLPAVAVSLQPSRATFPFSRLFAVRDRPPGADTFRLAGQRYVRGLWLHSPLKLVYRVPEGFRRFKAVAGIDDSVLAPGQFELVILGDNRELFRQTLGGDLSPQPISLDLDVSGLRRLTIVLEPAAGLDLGDQLDLCEARFTK